MADTATTEVFDLETVKGVMGSIQGEFSTLSETISSINSDVTAALGSPDKAVYGDAGDKILATWDENCSMLASFIGIFDNWSNMVVGIAHEYGELDKGTAVVDDVDKDAFRTIANASKSSWLKTSEAIENYKGSVSKYIDENGTEHTVTKKLETGITDEYEDDSKNKITDYYNLAHGVLDTATNGVLSKGVSSISELLNSEDKEQIKKAQDLLKDKVATKHEELKARDDERKELMLSNTQASKFAELGKEAYNEYGPIKEGSARDKWIKEIAKIVKRANKSKIKNSLVIAQIINESGWMNPKSERAKVFLDMNNVLGINYDLDYDISTQKSSWSKNPQGEDVWVVQGTDNHLEKEKMRSYKSLEQGIEDYCDMVVTRHPYVKGSNNIEDYRNYLSHYTPYCTEEGGATGKYSRIIKNYGLDKYDE